MKAIYHAFFVNDPTTLKKMFVPVHTNQFYHHATIQFKPKNTANIQTGRPVTLKISGYLQTDKIQCLVVDGDKFTNEFPHITLTTAQGISPAESNAELTAHRDKIVYFPDAIELQCVEGYFDGKDRK